MNRAESSSTLVNEFLEHLRRDLNRSPNTIYCYARDYTLLLGHLGATHVLEATTDDLRAFLRRPRRGQCEVMPATLKREVATLRSLYRYLTEARGLAVDNPARRLHSPTVHNEDPHPAPLDAWRKLWDSDLDDAERAAFGLAYFCGLRRHEVTGLAPWQVSADRLQGMKRKGGRKVALPWLSSVRFYEQRGPEHGDASLLGSAMLRLAAQRQDRPHLLPWADGPRCNGRPVNPTRFNHALRVALACSGQAELTFSPHALRHSFVTNMLNMGVDLLVVSRLAGHTSVAVTQRYALTAEDPLATLLDPPSVTQVGRWG